MSIQTHGMAAELPSELPEGYPREISGLLAWTGATLEDGDKRLYVQLSKQDIADIDRALQHFKGGFSDETSKDNPHELYIERCTGLGIARGFASPETFPLPEALHQRLRDLNQAVYAGLGFCVLRGLEPATYTEEERVILYAGLTSHVANLRARNIGQYTPICCFSNRTPKAYSIVLDHIRDRTKDNPLNETLKPPEQTVPMTFHTDIDVYDMLTMFTQTVPLDGGHQYLSSMASVYNILAAEDPGTIKTLSEDWYWERSHRYL